VYWLAQDLCRLPVVEEFEPERKLLAVEVTELVEAEDKLPEVEELPPFEPEHKSLLSEPEELVELLVLT